MRRWLVMVAAAVVLASAGAGLWFWQQPHTVEEQIRALPGVRSVETEGTTEVTFERSTTAEQLSTALRQMCELGDAEDGDAQETIDVTLGPVGFTVDDAGPSIDDVTALATSLAAVSSVHEARIGGSINVWTTDDADVVPTAQRILANVARSGLDGVDLELEVIAYGGAGDSADGRSLEIEKAAMDDVAKVRQQVDLLARSLSESGASFEDGGVAYDGVSLTAAITSGQGIATAFGTITRTFGSHPITLTLESEDLELLGSSGTERVPLIAVLAVVGRLQSAGMNVTSVAAGLESIQVSVGDASQLQQAIGAFRSSRDPRIPNDTSIELNLGEHAGLRGTLPQVSATAPLILELQRAGLEGFLAASGSNGKPNLHVYADKQELSQPSVQTELMSILQAPALPTDARIELSTDDKDVFVGAGDQLTTMAPVLFQLLRAKFGGSFDATGWQGGPVLVIGSNSELNDLRESYVQSELIRVLRRGAWRGELRLEIAGVRQDGQGNDIWPPLRFTSTVDGEATAVYPTGEIGPTEPGTLPNGPDGRFVRAWNATAS